MSETLETNQKVKLTQSALNKFITWSTSRYNQYLGFGNKADAVQTIYDALTNRKEGTLLIECAGGVGESYSRSWSTKQSGKSYLVDCKAKSITEQNSNTVIFFQVPGKPETGLSVNQETLIKQVAGVEGSALGVKYFKKHLMPKRNQLFISPDGSNPEYHTLQELCRLGYMLELEHNGYAKFVLTDAGLKVAGQLIGLKNL